METLKSKVYVLVDEQNRITRCEGGYTISNIKDIDQWTYIDEGHGDRYNLCQSHYFEGGLYTMEGIPRYKLVELGIEAEQPYGAELRTEEEIQADLDAIPVPETPETDTPTWDELAAAIQEGVDSV